MAVALTTQTLVAQVPTYVPTNGLVGYWPFNGNANDESGNGNNGVVNGATLTSDRFGNSGSAYNFDGINNFIQCLNAGPTGNPTITASFWLKSSQSTPAEILGYGKNGVSGNDFRVYINGHCNGGSIAFDTYDNAKVLPTTFNNIWDFYVVIYDGVLGTNTSVAKIYKNGTLLTSVCFTVNISSTNIGSLIPMVFGRYHGNVETNYYNGSLDEIGIWNRALTQQEITNLFSSVSSNECLTMTINTGVLSTNPVTYNSTVNIYPNPANDQITIDCGNLANVVGWNIKITNMLGQEVFNQLMNTQQYVVPLNSWTGQGMYFVKISNAQNEVVNIKKIILQ